MGIDLKNLPEKKMYSCFIIWGFTLIFFLIAKFKKIKINIVDENYNSVDLNTYTGRRRTRVDDEDVPELPSEEESISNGDYSEDDSYEDNENDKGDDDEEEYENDEPKKKKKEPGKKNIPNKKKKGNNPSKNKKPKKK